MGRIGMSWETERTVTQARTEAIRLGHSQVGSEHLVLALLVRRCTEAAWILQACGWDAAAWRQLVGRVRGRGIWWPRPPVGTR